MTKKIDTVDVFACTVPPAFDPPTEANRPELTQVLTRLAWLTVLDQWVDAAVQPMIPVIHADWLISPKVITAAQREAMDELALMAVEGGYYGPADRWELAEARQAVALQRRRDAWRALNGIGDLDANR